MSRLHDPDGFDDPEDEPDDDWYDPDEPEEEDDDDELGDQELEEPGGDQWP